jgi:hypothetical protein
MVICLHSFAEIKLNWNFGLKFEHCLQIELLTFSLKEASPSYAQHTTDVVGLFPLHAVDNNIVSRV